TGQVEPAADFLGICVRLQARGQHHHVHGNAAGEAKQRVFHADDELAFLARVEGPVGDFRDLAPYEVHSVVAQLLVELLEALAGGADVDVEVENLGVGVLFEQVRQLERVHAADARAPAVGFFVARSDAVDNGDRLGALAVAQHHFARGRPRGIHQPLDFQRRVDVGVDAVAVFRRPVRIEDLETGGENDGPHIDDLGAFLHLQVDRMALAAGVDAGLLALAGLEVDAGFRVDDRHLRNGLREGDIDRLALAQPHVEFVYELALLVDACLDALQAADTKVFHDVARLASHRHLEVADVPIHLGHFGVGPQGDIGMGAHRRHLRGQDAGGAIEGGEGLIELGHVAADGRFPLHQVDLLAGVGKRQGRVDAGDAAADHQNTGVDGNA